MLWQACLSRYALLRIQLASQLYITPETSRMSDSLGEHATVRFADLLLSVHLVLKQQSVAHMLAGVRSFHCAGGADPHWHRRHCQLNGAGRQLA